jgi:hypothetical protein
MAVWSRYTAVSSISRGVGRATWNVSAPIMLLHFLSISVSVKPIAHDVDGGGDEVGETIGDEASDDEVDDDADEGSGRVLLETCRRLGVDVAIVARVGVGTAIAFDDLDSGNADEGGNSDARSEIDAVLLMVNILPLLLLLPLLPLLLLLAVAVVRAGDGGRAV